MSVVNLYILMILSELSACTILLDRIKNSNIPSARYLGGRQRGFDRVHLLRVSSIHIRKCSKPERSIYSELTKPSVYFD